MSYIPCENNYTELEERKNKWIENNLIHEVTFFEFLRNIFPDVTENDNMLFKDYEYGKYTDWKVRDICKWIDAGLDEVIYIIGDSAKEKEIKEKMYPDFYAKHCYQY